MKRAVYFQKELDQVSTVEGLTSVFESIASLHIAQIKDKVVASTLFFNELWTLYNQLRLGNGIQGARRKPGLTNRRALVAITSEGGLIGDIDQRIVEAMLGDPAKNQSDIFIIGAHGATLVGRRGAKAKKVFALPDADIGADISFIARAINQYEHATVYYQTYVSLLRQEVAKIDLFSAVQELQQKPGSGHSSDDIISARDYIFEPSLEEILAYMEGVMLEIAMGQVLLESKLAQYASRFNAMSAAKTKAQDMRSDLKLLFNRAKRAQSDERSKEIVSALKVIRRP